MEDHVDLCCMPIKFMKLVVVTVVIATLLASPRHICCDGLALPIHDAVVHGDLPQYARVQLQSHHATLRRGVAFSGFEHHLHSPNAQDESESLMRLLAGSSMLISPDVGGISGNAATSSSVSTDIDAASSPAVSGNMPMQTQAQQMSDAMVLKSMRGTQWRIIEERDVNDPRVKQALSEMAVGTNGKRPKVTEKTTQLCTSIATFSGFADEPNKGTMAIETTCTFQDARGSVARESSVPTTIVTNRSSGRWLTKPSEIRRGAVQLSARWKIKEAGSRYIYKGFIKADPTRGRDGVIAAEISGVVWMVNDGGNGNDRVVGKFRGDLRGPVDVDRSL